MPAASRLRRLASAALLALAATGVASCEEHRARRDSITLEHGNAVAHNIAVQTIDPWPANSRNNRIDIDGERILVGVERYKANKSIPPKGLSTQSVSTGTGGGAAK